MDYDNLDQTETNHDETAWLVFSAVADRQFTQMWYLYFIDLFINLFIN